MSSKTTHHHCGVLFCSTPKLHSRSTTRSGCALGAATSSGRRLCSNYLSRSVCGGRIWRGRICTPNRCRDVLSRYDHHKRRNKSGRGGRWNLFGFHLPPLPLLFLYRSTAGAFRAGSRVVQKKKLSRSPFWVTMTFFFAVVGVVDRVPPIKGGTLSTTPTRRLRQFL